MPTLPERLRQAAQYTGLDSIRELLIEAAGALEGAEPVAWIQHHKAGDNLVWDNPGGKCSPLYIAPQPPERKPLTEWQIVDLMREWKDGETIADLIRLVEARHGIKD